MLNNVKCLGLFITISLVAISCSTTQKYGNRTEKYSRTRSEAFSNGSTRMYRDVTIKSNETNKSTDNIKSVDRAKKSNFEMMKRESLISSAQKFIGTPYKYAGRTPDEGFDCSGFAGYVYTTNGYNISGPSYELAMKGTIKKKEDLEAGDLIFFGENEKITHVAIVTENKNQKIYFIHSSTSQGVKIDELNNSEYWLAKFLFGRDVLQREIN